MLIVLLLREPAGVVAGPEEDLLQAMAFPVLETLSPSLDYFVGKGEPVQIRWGLELSRNSLRYYAVGGVVTCKSGTFSLAPVPVMI